ncbi:rhodanese-like domain-containing protein [Psychromonas antarctica]|uniref:rhodanese-like domain-containing protein n=1 Tax=Psychromonas antarctica TaxID=67573 RepID=UPI001EE849DE|nr:rhodanese-like domain-containing protein [Psychromonas antarctica]MCG6201865.1 sulfurtransferase [Psychromonas antarctica]
MSYLFKTLPIIAFACAPTYALTFDDISTQYIENGRLSDKIQIIDCRSSNQYNGWPAADANSEGHFPGAVNVDSQWLTLLDNKQLQQLISDRQIQKDKPTFLYCANDDSKALRLALKKQGLKKVEIINQDLTQASEKLITLPNFKQLVSPQWLHKVINGDKTSYAPKKNYKLIEVQWGPAIKYLAAHIPSALYLDTNEIETEPWWNRVSDKKIAELLKNLGIRYDTTVILYGRNNMAAARAANIMMYAGVDDVRLLNGGWQAWLDSGFAIESFMNSNSQKVEFGKLIPANPHYIIDIPQAKALLAKDPRKHSLVSVRTWDEYTGKTSGYSYIKEKGRITGSKWGHAGTDSNNVADFLNPDGTMKSENAIKQLWQSSNINQDQQVAFYCGTGWRASEVFFYTYVMGWKNISVFDGGWYEWSGNKNNPISAVTEKE